MIEELFENAPSVYVDMDGVLVDFAKGAYELVGGPLSIRENKKAFWKKIKQMPVDEMIEFWAGLDWTSDGQALWNALQKYNPIILSSPGHSMRKEIEQAKSMWIQRHLAPRPTKVIYEVNKYVHASPGAILIDDMSKNIDPWNEHGGIGILHTAGHAEQTVSMVRRILS